MMSDEQRAFARLLDTLAGTEMEAYGERAFARIEAIPHVPSLSVDGVCAFCGERCTRKN